MSFYQVPGCVKHFLKVKKVFVCRLRIDALYFSERSSFALAHRYFLNATNFMLYDVNISYRESTDDYWNTPPPCRTMHTTQKIEFGENCFPRDIFKAS